MNIPDRFCADCSEYDDVQTPAEHEWDLKYQGSGGLFLCDRCADRRIGSGERTNVPSIQERYVEALHERLELRKRD